MTIAKEKKALRKVKKRLIQKTAKGLSSLPWHGLPARYEFRGFRVVGWWFAQKFGSQEVEVEAEKCDSQNCGR